MTQTMRPPTQTAQAQLLGLAVSPVKRRMRPLSTEDGDPWLTMYRLSAMIEGEDDVMQHFKDILDRKCPPIYAELVKR